MTQEEKLKFVAEMEQEEHDQRAAANLKDFAYYAERKGILPPSGSDPESKARRDEWYAANAPRGVWITRSH